MLERATGAEWVLYEVCHAILFANTCGLACVAAWLAWLVNTGGSQLCAVTPRRLLPGTHEFADGFRVAAKPCDLVHV